LGGKNGLLLSEAGEIEALLKNLILPEKPFKPGIVIDGILDALDVIDVAGIGSILGLGDIISWGKSLIDELFICIPFIGCVPGKAEVDAEIQPIIDFVNITILGIWEQKVSKPIDDMITLLQNGFNDLTCETITSADNVIVSLLDWSKREEKGLQNLSNSIAKYINDVLNPLVNKTKNIPKFGPEIKKIVESIEESILVFPNSILELFQDLEVLPVGLLQDAIDSFKGECDAYKKLLNELLEVKKLLKELEETRLNELVKYDIHVDIRKIQEDLSTGVGNEEINGCLKSLKNVDTGEVLYPNGLLDIFCIAWDQLNKETDNTSIINPLRNPTYKTLLSKENLPEAKLYGSLSFLAPTSNPFESPLSGGHSDADKGIYTLPVEVFTHCKKLEFNGKIYKIIKSVEEIPCRDSVLLQTGMGQASNDVIAVYSFSLRPEEHQPSGTCNFSRIDNSRLVINNVNDKCCFSEYDVYAINYNVLRIMSGMGGLAYSN
jgi:hypothetical protein